MTGGGNSGCSVQRRCAAHATAAADACGTLNSKSAGRCRRRCGRRSQDDITASGETLLLAVTGVRVMASQPCSMPGRRHSKHDRISRQCSFHHLCVSHQPWRRTTLTSKLSCAGRQGHSQWRQRRHAGDRHAQRRHRCHRFQPCGWRGVQPDQIGHWAGAPSPPSSTGDARLGGCFCESSRQHSRHGEWGSLCSTTCAGARIRQRAAAWPRPSRSCVARARAHREAQQAGAGIGAQAHRRGDESSCDGGPLAGDDLRRPSPARLSMPETLSSATVILDCLHSSAASTVQTCLQVSAPLQPPAQGSGSFSPARVRQSPLKLRQAPMMAGDVSAPAGTAAPVPVPPEQLSAPTKAKRTLNRHGVAPHMLSNAITCAPKAGRPSVMPSAHDVHWLPASWVCFLHLKQCCLLQDAKGPHGFSR